MYLDASVLVRRRDQAASLLCAYCFYFPCCSFSLSDIDECAVPSTCDAQAACTNNPPPGSFTCMCNPGYSGDGMTCTGKTECIYRRVPPERPPSFIRPPPPFSERSLSRYLASNEGPPSRYLASDAPTVHNEVPKCA